MNTLIINSYGGSLVLGTKTLGMEILASMEDSNFGLDIQKENFPELNYYEYRKDWPNFDLSETVVLAHPPCSAFSVQNSRPSDKRGADSAAFACTKSVLQYCVDNHALAFAIESVTGALAGAWGIHQYYADNYGYNIYRVLESGCMFGAQWRDRFWVVYVKKGAAHSTMSWTLSPKFETVKDVIHDYMDGPTLSNFDKSREKLITKLEELSHCTQKEIEWIFTPNPEYFEAPYGYALDYPLWRLKYPQEERWPTCQKYVTRFASSAPQMLNPDGLSPVLLGSSWWLYNGQNLSKRAYKRLMGFPADYVFPEKGHYDRDMCTYLSKGVMPPIAAWILDQITTHLGRVSTLPLTNSGIEPYQIFASSNDIIDFRIKKKEWGEPRPSLREETEEDIKKKQSTFATSSKTESEPMARKEVRSQYTQPVIIETFEEKYARMTMEIERLKQEEVMRIKCEELEAQINELKMRRGDVPLAFAPPKPAPVVEYPSDTEEFAVTYEEIEMSKVLPETLGPLVFDSVSLMYYRPESTDSMIIKEVKQYLAVGPKPDDILLDIGAQIGATSKIFSRFGVKQIISVEPEPGNFELLTKNVGDVATLVNAAVVGSDEQEKANLWISKSINQGLHSVGRKRRDREMLEVEAISLNKLLNDYKPTIVKIDIEGGEYDMLDSLAALPNYVRGLMMEIHRTTATFNKLAPQLVASIEAQGFKPIKRPNMQNKAWTVCGVWVRDIATA